METYVSVYHRTLTSAHSSYMILMIHLWPDTSDSTKHMRPYAALFIGQGWHGISNVTLLRANNAKGTSHYYNTLQVYSNPSLFPVNDGTRSPWTSSSNFLKRLGLLTLLRSL